MKIALHIVKKGYIEIFGFGKFMKSSSADFVKVVRLCKFVYDLFYCKTLYIFKVII